VGWDVWWLCYWVGGVWRLFRIDGATHGIGAGAEVWLVVGADREWCGGECGCCGWWLVGLVVCGGVWGVVEVGVVLGFWCFLGVGGCGVWGCGFVV